MFVAQSPFERLTRLLADTPPGKDPIDLSVGSPRHPAPSFIGEVIARHTDGFVAYPPIAGTAEFQRAVHDWLDRRYGLEGWFRESGAVLPLNGSREGLFSAAITARDLAGKREPAILFANPFYQAYPAAAHALGAEAVPLPCTRGFLADLDAVAPSVLQRAVAYYVAVPSNPQGHTASLEDWHALFDRAERHGFLLFADECYSEIYREAAGPPVGALAAARQRPSVLPRLLVFNSLSKRSNLAGMRVGFVAGHPQIITALRDFRNQAAPQVPTPLQAAAAAAFDDEAHVSENRRLYDAKFAAAEGALGAGVAPPAGFFLWLAIDGDDVAAARALWSEAGVKAVPGSYLALTGSGQTNPGRGFVRLALVADPESTERALSRVARVLFAAA